MHCTGIYRDANLQRKFAYFVAAMRRIYHAEMPCILLVGDMVSLFQFSATGHKSINQKVRVTTENVCQ